MNIGSDRNAVRAQYGTAQRLDTRISIHNKYSVNRTGFANWLFALCEPPEDARVLELGCGTGALWQGRGEAVRRCARLCLTDLSEGILEKARETVGEQEHVEYRIVDAMDLPYADGSFDLVFAHMMLYHVPDLGRALAEIRRVLVPDGVLWCATYGEHGIQEFLAETFASFGVRDSLNRNFTLQNGEATLRRWFSEVTLYRYEDALHVTDVGDMADYALSLLSMEPLRALPREEVTAALEWRAENGILTVPKEYGVFAARKGEPL